MGVLDTSLGLKVLLQHGRTQLRDAARTALSDAGCQVHLSGDGIEGLTQLLVLRPDIIITGISLPQLDGLGFIEAVRRLDYLRAVPVLVMSANTSPVLKTRARNVGASGWLSYPFSHEQLVASVRAAVPVRGNA